MEIKKVCGNCNHFVDGGDWNLCCTVLHPTKKEKEEGKTFPFGHLCYENTPPCDMWEKGQKFHIEKATKQVEELFKTENEEEKNNTFYISKLVNVSDPNNWYYANKIICSLYHASPVWNLSRETKDMVRILFKSYDDFMMYRDFNYYDLKGNWKFCKEHYFDSLPDTVNVEWLYRHGYVPF